MIIKYSSNEVIVECDEDDIPMVDDLVKTCLFTTPVIAGNKIVIRSQDTRQTALYLLQVLSNELDENVSLIKM